MFALRAHALHTETWYESVRVSRDVCICLLWQGASRDRNTAFASHTYTTSHCHLWENAWAWNSLSLVACFPCATCARADAHAALTNITTHQASQLGIVRDTCRIVHLRRRDYCISIWICFFFFIFSCFTLVNACIRRTVHRTETLRRTIFDSFLLYLHIGNNCMDYGFEVK